MIALIDCVQFVQDYVMMVRWLPETESTIPPNASTYVGIGAFVVNDQNEVLVVQERTGPAKGRGWKLPTGLIEQGEEIWLGAEREVLEETGVKARFEV